MTQHTELLSADSISQNYQKINEHKQKANSLPFFLYSVIIFLAFLLVITTTLTVVGFSVNKKKGSVVVVNPEPEADSGPLVVDLITYNDVYQIDMVQIDESGQLGGGPSRASRYIKDVRKSRRENAKNVLVLSGGDTISPSGLSTLFFGKQMIEVNNLLGLDYSVLGNHEFDYTLEVLQKRMSESNFTWLCANIEMPLPIKKNVIVQTMNKKIGIFGLIYDFAPVFPSVKIKDVMTTAEEQVAELKAAGADYIIALTHLDTPSDCDLSFVKGIDLIVGGHDHRVKMNADCGPTVYLKATMDWINMWHVRIDFSYPKPVLRYTSIPITKDMPTDPVIDDLIVRYNAAKHKEFSVVLAKTQVALETRASIMRTKESNMANYCSDKIRDYMQADLAVVNGGTIRANKIYPANINITKGDVNDMFPFQTGYIVVSMNGTVLRQVIEHGVSQVENVAGRFLHVSSGFRYGFSAKRPTGQRVTQLDKIDNGNVVPVQPSDEFAVALGTYIYGGGDGFKMLAGLPIVSAKDFEPIVANMIVQALVKDSVINPQNEGRIVETE